MSLETIHAAVSASARLEAERIVKIAEQHAAERVAREVEAIRRAEERRFRLAANGIGDTAVREVARAKGEASKRLLGRRNALLDSIFGEAKRRILALPREQYAAEMRRRLEFAAGTAGGTVRVHPGDASAFGPILSAINEGRPAGAKLILDTSAPLPERGGFVLVADSYDVDQTIGALFSTLRYDLGPLIAAELFTG